MAANNRSKWAACFGVTGAFILAGVLVASASRPAIASDSTTGVADTAQLGAQTPQPTSTGEDLARGRHVYDRACGRCHPGGEEDVGPRLVNKNFDEARMVKQVRQGVGRMRPVPATKLPEANMPALMAYLRSIHAVR